MKIYNSIEELEKHQTMNFEYWSGNGEDFYDRCLYDCFNSAIDGIDDDQKTVRLTGGRISKELTFGDLVEVDTLIESADNTYYDITMSEDSAYEGLDESVYDRWLSELNKLVVDKFNELPSGGLLSNIDITETFEVRINKGDLE